MPGTAQVNVNPRKIPRQARAQATVEAIIVATAQLLTEQGFVNLTTARVAERAGVSIGSLYQYFPNKQGLAAAVVDHYSDEVLARFTAMVRAAAREDAGGYRGCDDRVRARFPSA